MTFMDDSSAAGMQPLANGLQTSAACEIGEELYTITAVLLTLR